MRLTTKEIEIEGRRYQLGKMSAMVASWVANVLLATMVKNNDLDKGEQPTDDGTPPEERAAQAVSALWLVSSATLSPEVYTRIQQSCLISCSFYDGDKTVAEPVISMNGKFVDKELEKDGPAVGRLVQECLVFNLAPFFIASASSAPATA